MIVDDDTGDVYVYGYSTAASSTATEQSEGVVRIGAVQFRDLIEQYQQFEQSE